MHLRFRPSLPDPQSQNPQRSYATPAVLLSRISQIWPKSERLNALVIYSRALIEDCRAFFSHQEVFSCNPKNAINHSNMEGIGRGRLFIAAMKNLGIADESSFSASKNKCSPSPAFLTLFSTWHAYCFPSSHKSHQEVGMFDNIMVQVSAKMPSLGITSSSVPEEVGEDGPPAANFTDLLQAIVSGLDKGLGNLQGGSLIRADGKTASSDNLMDLMQKLSNGKGIESDKKSTSGNSMTDVLQQMMAQLQASFAQPVAFIAPDQSNNTSSSDTSSIAATGTGMDSGNDGAGALIATLERAIQKGDVKKQNVIDTPELPAAGQTACKQLDMYSVPLTLTQDTVITDQNAPVAAQDNAQTSGANLELAAFSVAAQKNLTNNTERPALNTATLNIGNDTRLNTANATTLNTANTATLTTANAATLTTANTATLNIANDIRLNTANAATLTTANAATLTTANTATLNIANDTRLNTANATTLTTANTATLTTANTATLTTANDTAQNTANASMLNSEQGALNSLTEGTTGDLGIKEIRLTSNNENKSMSGDADNNAAFSPVPLQQTPVANESQPAQETLPVNKLNELSDPIMTTLGSGGKNLLIKLSPPDMGTIEIRLKMENGVLTADFKVDSTAVKDLFSFAMPEIKNSIESAGIKTGNFFADLKDDRYTDGGRQQDANQQQQRQQKEQKPSFFDFFA